MTYQTHNVASEKKDPNSILNFYKNLLALRHTNRALLDGDYIALNQDDPNVYSYLRSYKGPGCAGGAQHVGESAEVEFRSFEARLQHRARPRRC